jgi:CBS domain-containing protein/gamma-glutamylcysteine synthetase
MGDLSVKAINSQKNRHHFLQHLLKDVQALDLLLERDLFEKAPIRIGAEQELAVMANDYSPSAHSQHILDICKDPHVTSEVAQFNLEVNLDPFPLRDHCFRQTEEQLNSLLKHVYDLADKTQQKILLTGILPTINRNHLHRSYMMPYDRYHFLSDMIKAQRGSNFEIHIQGSEELIAQLDTVLFEACNTSFQMHLQLRADEFVEKYNWAQQIAGPVLAGMVNSPLLLGRVLWQETRIALFRQSLDTRTAFNHLRDKQARVFFGNDWLKSSVSMLFKENIARFPQLITKDIIEDSLESIEKGEAPALRALRIHNGTVYNWNRPCYGRANNIPHLRLENRYIPAGPSTKDEIANFAFWVGLMNGMPTEKQDFYQEESFDYAKENFYRAAQTGLQSVFNWFGKEVSARTLILEELLPLAEAGLHKAQVAAEDIRHYLGIFEKRIQKSITGAQWQLNNFRELRHSYGLDAGLKILTKGMYELQQSGEALHEWPTQLHQQYHLIPKPEHTVSQIMNTDLFTVEEEESVDLVKALMEWHKIRHMPVENADGNLSGLVSANYLNQLEEKPDNCIRDIMVTDLVTVPRDCTIKAAVELMKHHDIGCLPIVRDEKITGIVTDSDFRNLGFW